MTFFYKIQNFPHMLPTSVTRTISPDSPLPTTHTAYRSDWYSTYNSSPYNASTFFKGPLLYSSIMTNNNELNSTNINTYKRNLKTYLLKVQSSGDILEWSPRNFKLTNIQGLRSSARIKSQSAVTYSE